MTSTTGALLTAALLATSAGRAATKPDPTGHYTEHVCDFGQHGLVTVHQGGFGKTYIVVRGKMHPSTGGGDFVQSDDDDSVAVTFDRKGIPYYQGETRGRKCRVVRH